MFSLGSNTSRVLKQLEEVEADNLSFIRDFFSFKTK